MIREYLLPALFLAFSLMNWGCQKVGPPITENVEIRGEPENIQEEEEANPESIGSFVSRDNRVRFSYKKGWICKEVIYGVRVDCYPKDRDSEKYDMGFDEMTVPYSEITLLLDHCDGADPYDFEISGRLPNFVKKYGNCNTLVLIDDGPSIDSEADLDRVIWSTDSPGPDESDPGYVLDPKCAEFEDQVMLKIQEYHATTGANAQLDNLFFSSKYNRCLYSWTAVEEYAHFYFIGDPSSDEPYLETVHGCYEPYVECPLTYGKAFAEYQKVLKSYL